MADLQNDGHRQKPNERVLMWGHGHGRRKFKVNDHLDKDTDGIECYLSSKGHKLGSVKHKKVEDHLNPTSAVPSDPVIFLDPDGKSISFKPRNHVPVKDTVDELMNCEVQSENSN